MEKLILRLLFVPVTLFFVFQLFAQFGKSLNDLIYNLTEDSYEIFLRFDTRDKVVFWISLSWIIMHIFFEIYAYYSKNFRFKRTLTNLRYAPIAVFFISLFVVPIYDLGMIAYSRHQIRNYIFSDSQTTEKPDLRLHNDYRHWCGNGAMGRYKDLYFDTAIEGIDSEDPKVRVRSMLLADDVLDWLNERESEKLDKILIKSCKDPDTEVKRISEDFLHWRESDCATFLLSK